ncbi:MAG: ThuA domain-containing protein [Lentisphaeria bacterium]|jgi:hypothetical protein
MKKALMIWGGWGGHTPRESTERAAGLLRGNGFAVTVADSLDALLDPAAMAGLDLIVLCVTMATLGTEQEQALLAAVRGGVGLSGWHGGLCDAFRANPEYQFMTGGQWVAHPGNCIDYVVNVTRPDDPIMRGIRDFTMPNSEQYYLHVDPGNEVLATTTFSGEHDGIAWIKGTVMPVVWKRRWGQGRVFYSALGHTVQDFAVPEAALILERGLCWAAK